MDECLRRLAMAVLLQAIKDARRHKITAERVRAQHFLRGGDGLAVWCNLAGVQQATVTRWAMIEANLQQPIDPGTDLPLLELLEDEPHRLAS